MAAVALVGADGTGKTTVAREVSARLPNARYLYMGVNLDASTVVLPTTRLGLELKRRLGGRPDISAPRGDRRGRKRGLLGRIRSEIRYANLIAEEWFRHIVAWYHQRGGTLVVFDRHFVWDYHATLPRRGERGAPGFQGLHDRLLRDRFPRPDLVICLDAPAELLVARKGGDTVEQRRARQGEYLELGSTTTDGFVTVSVDQPTEAVIADVMQAIADRLGRRAAP